MKKTLVRIVNCVLLLSIIFSLISLPAGAQHATELNATEVDVAETLVPQGVSQQRSVTNFTCGDTQTGAFGNMMETHQYSVYLQANKGVAFASTGMITLMQIYDPDGVSIGTITTVSNTSSARYGVLTLPNKTGYYTIRVTGAMGGYTLNCLTGQNTTSHTNTVYNRQLTEIYAATYWNSYNSDYHLFDKDATNFVSQCIHEGGGMPMETGTDNFAHWYYLGVNNRSSTWAGADEFMCYWTKVRLSSNNGEAYSVKIYTSDYVKQNFSTLCANVGVGDIILYAPWSADSEVNHTAIISGVSTVRTNISFYSHSSNQNNGSLETYLNNEIRQTNWVIIVRISSN